MQIRTLGRSGCAVSAFALGTMTFGREADEAASHEQLDTYVEAGGNLVDTADVYADTESEAIIGRWLAKASPEVRNRVVLATKGRFPTDDSPNGLGLSRRHLSMALDASLRRLQVETIDLYQVHAWDPITPLDETLRFFDDAVRAGKVRYFGLSNFTGWQLQRAVTTAELRGWTRPVTLQPQYNLLAREIEWEIVPACLSEGLGLLPWSPLGGGWLTGKYDRDERPTGATRLGENPDYGVEAYGKRSALERTWDVVDAVRAVADGRGVPMASVALAWLRERPAVTSVILGARTTEQLAANLGAADLVLSADETSRLDAASDPGAADYPYGVAGTEQRDRRIEGGR
jgi:aryl-alcohol dehydrogenase-like predicted oxidoreductase